MTVGLNVLELTVQLYHRDVIVQSWIGYVGTHHRALSSRCHYTGCRRGSQDDNWKVKTEFSFIYSAFPKKRRDGHQPDREDVHLEVGVELGVRVNIPLTQADLRKYHFDLISSLKELLRLSLWLFDKCCSLHLKTYPQLLWSVLVDAVGGSQEVRVV